LQDLVPQRGKYPGDAALKTLAVLGGNDPHSYGVTSHRASMNTLRPTILKNTKGTIVHLSLPYATST